MTRLIFVVLLVAVSATTRANTSELFTPYSPINVNAGMYSESVADRILLFVNFDCPYSRLIHEGIRKWADGLPSTLFLEVVPSIGMDDHFLMASSYYAVLIVRPVHAESYMFDLYAALQDRGQNISNPTTYSRIAAKYGITEAQFKSALLSPKVKNYTRRAAEITKLYGLRESPVAVVMNKYIAYPKNVNNRPEDFVTVLTGLVSGLVRGEIDW